ncbi:hypothetical protein Ahy_A07g034219 isoform E [Arachis hypogaea]|uniref:Uncharacterized protein n=1 Tax=Arachis hypogaea TaxID=3818 RepID=A0A445CBL9_ARAHY|nr:hypothetical protein Ahy_A07g034219 isoform E [Arachis hypogaea]
MTVTNPKPIHDSHFTDSVRPYSIPSSKPPSPSLNSSPPPEGVVAAGNVTDRACRSRRLLLQPLLSLCFPIAATSAAPSGSVSLFSSQPRPPLLCHRPPEASISPSAVPPPVSPPAAICPSTELSLGRLQPLFLPPALFASVSHRRREESEGRSVDLIRK